MGIGFGAFLQSEGTAYYDDSGRCNMSEALLVMAVPSSRHLAWWMRVVLALHTMWADRHVGG
jgi:hypothetical protein